jgi:hypothetical protein
MPRGLSPYASARIQSRLWTPALARQYRGAWYRFTDPSCLTISGGNVTGARDLFGVHDLTAATSGANLSYDVGLGEMARYRMPTFPAGGASGAYLKATLSSGQALYNATAIQVVALCRTASSTRKGLCTVRSNHSADFSSWSGSFADFAQRGTDSFLTGYAQVISIGYSTNTWFIWSAQVGINGFLHEVFRNDAMTATASSNRGSNVGTTAGTRMNIGAADVLQSSAEYLNGQIAEMVIFAGAGVNNHLRRKAAGSIAWGHGMQHLLPAAHPFRNRPPLIGD